METLSEFIILLVIMIISIELGIEYNKSQQTPAPISQTSSGKITTHSKIEPCAQ